MTFNSAVTRENGFSGPLTRSDKNRAVQKQKKLEISDLEEE